MVGWRKAKSARPGSSSSWLPGREHPLELAPIIPRCTSIQQIRDEAHRFAIQGIARVAPRPATSVLDAVEASAPSENSASHRFGGLRGLLAASVDDLAQVEGVSRTLAEKIYQELH
jgi:excinuclease ABC subunit C